MDMSQYIEIFTEEAKEHLQNLNEGMLSLEKTPDELKILDEIFRSAHTLKGMSATMGFEKMAELTHLMENVLSKLKNGDEKISVKVMDVLFKCLDLLEQMVHSIIEGGNGDIPTEEIMTELRLIEKGEYTPEKEIAAAISTATTNDEQNININYTNIKLNEYEESILKQAIEKQYIPYQLKINIDQSCLMKVARAFMVFRDLEDIGEIVKSIPSVQEIEDEKFEDYFELVLISKENEEKIKKTINSIVEVKLDYIKEIDPQLAAGLENYSSDLTTNIAQTDKINSTAKKDNRKSKAMQTVRVDIERLDNLMNLVGELVISKTRLEQISSSGQLNELTETIEHIDLISSDLQAVVMKVRMVPLEQVFNRFPRMIRDLSKELNKPVNLIIKGEDTELDRTVIDEIGDPLVHLLRNAIDHGIESVAEREKKGKPAEAMLRLEAWYEGNNVVIEVEDDGKGIPTEIIKRKAIEKNLISAAEAEQLDDYAIVNMIFQSGFSTASQVTDISGRGVGLDAVRTKIDSLNGSVDVQTVEGKGSKFTIKLPLTLAIIQALLVQVGLETYAIPLSSIDETTHVNKGDIKRIQDKEVMLLRGNILPLIRLDKYLGTPEIETETDEYYVVVVRKGDRQAGLIVDSLIGQQDIVIKTLGKLLTGISGLSGATILGNGHVALILDIGTLI